MSVHTCSLKSSWLIFLSGLLIGFILFATYSRFFQSTSQPASQEFDLPVTFDINPTMHILGNYNAPVTFVVFNDFTCPYCQEYALRLEELVRQYPSQVRVIWKHFPLNKNYLTAAIASECAYEQGNFWEYAHLLYSHNDAYLDEDYINWALQLGLDQAQFDACFTSHRYQAKVETDYYEGIIKGVIGAPATFINGDYIAGSVPYQRLVEIVEELS